MEQVSQVQKAAIRQLRETTTNLEPKQSDGKGASLSGGFRIGFKVTGSPLGFFQTYQVMSLCPETIPGDDIPERRWTPTCPCSSPG